MRAHAVLSPSGSARWIHCAGSVQMESGEEDVPTPHAIEGTKAHNLAEHCLRFGPHPLDVTAFPIPDEPWLFVPVDEEMRTEVAKYVDYCLTLALIHGGEQFIESQVSLEYLGWPGEHIWGTADFVLVTDAGDIHIVDLKYGKGVVVDAEGNSQLSIYALGAVLKHLAKDEEVGLPTGRTVTIHVVQPRVRGPQTHTLRVEELYEWWSTELGFQAGRALDPKISELVPGEHCRFCKAAYRCPALQAESLALAKQQFDVLPAGPELAQLLDAADKAELAIKAVREHAFREAEAGRPPEGWKLVERRGKRRWTDEAAVRAWADSLGVLEHALEPATLRSPAQMKKALGEIPDELVTQPTTGKKLVREDHPAAALPGQTFPVLEDEDD